MLYKNPRFDKARDAVLREFYNDKVHVEPAMIAMMVKRREQEVINRLADLGLRKKVTATPYKLRA